MHRAGLHGYAVIPLLLGFGCNVPGILATRVLDTRRERFIAATLISIGVPCASLQAMMFGLLSPHGLRYVLLVYRILAVVWFVLGSILRLTSKDFWPEIILEIPPYRRPSFTTLSKKVAMRLRGFLLEAVPVVLVGVLVIDIVYMGPSRESAAAPLSMSDPRDTMVHGGGTTDLRADLSYSLRARYKCS